MDIHRMEKSDFPAVMRLTTQFAQESLTEYGVDIDPDVVQKNFESMWETSFVTVVDDEVVGILGGRIVTDFCSKLPCYEEVIWFMERGHRKYGLALFRYVQQWCIVHGIKRMTMCYMANSYAETLAALYTKLGFKPMETRYIKVLS